MFKLFPNRRLAIISLLICSHFSFANDRHPLELEIENEVQTTGLRAVKSAWENYAPGSFFQIRNQLLYVAYDCGNLMVANFLIQHGATLTREHRAKLQDDGKLRSNPLTTAEEEEEEGIQEI